MTRVLFLHHSTGKKILLGGTNRYINKLTGKNDVKDYFKKYNKINNTDYSITDQIFPKPAPYGWKNYPYDYYNIWVKHAGEKPFMEEPTLEILVKTFDVIIFKHCFPVSKMLPDSGAPDVESEEKKLENFKLQYNVLKQKLHDFPETKFILWTPAVFNKNQLTKEEAENTLKFRNWIIEEWYEKGDNIYVWDFYEYETRGGMFLLDEYSEGSFNSHPNRIFASKVAPLFSQFIIDVIESKIK